MAYTQIIRKQIIKSDINTLWDFISSPENLEKITPTWMSFKITSKKQKPQKKRIPLKSRNLRKTETP